MFLLFSFSESQLEKENKNGQCCEFLKVESGLTYAGVYRLVKGIKGTKIYYYKIFFVKLNRIENWVTP